MTRAPSVSPFALFVSLWKNRYLLGQLVKREVLGRYKGSFLGLLWSFVTPLMMLAVYTYVFSIVFQAKWPSSSEGAPDRVHFAVLLFAGLIVFNIFSEVAGKSSLLIVHNSNYVKKTLFPIEILPVVIVLAALFHALMSLCILFLFCLGGGLGIPVTAILFPLVLLPLIFFCLGLTWIFSSVGVFFRDIQHILGLAITLMMFITPIFYSISAVPLSYQFFVQLNPISYFVEWARQVLILGQWPDPNAFFGGLVLSVIWAWIGFAWFQKTRRSFADVI